MARKEDFHIAIIPDGNRRWAKRQGVSVQEGYIHGARALRSLIESLPKTEVTHFTFWGSSKDNILKRGKRELSVLFSLTEQYLKEFSGVALSEKIRVRVLGDWEKLYPKNVRGALREVVDSTKRFKYFNFTILLAYDGRDEVIEAVNKSRGSKNTSHENFKKHLWTGDLPPVDLLIRTGSVGDPHNSAGFMMWQTAYSQLYFTDTFWPDFTARELKKATSRFFKTERRLGK